MLTLPTLYKRIGTGAMQEWTIHVDGDHYWTDFGQTGGKITQSAAVYCTPKNTGRSNATSAYQQAEIEAKAAWQKKLKKDYTQDQNAQIGQRSELIQGGILPMLAQKFSDHGDKIKYPCFIQPKLDGHRCIATNGLWSRTRKPITGVPHIEQAAKQYDYILDGELYNHNYHDKFEQLTHFIRKVVPDEGCQIVQYHVYDIAINDMPFATRLQLLYNLQFALPIVLVETQQAENEDELMIIFEKYLAQGYEGAIVRNADSYYVNKRSTDLLKIKKFDDDEFICVNVEEGKGKMAGHAIFICVTSDGTEFKAKLKGNHDDLVKYVENPNLVIGKQITVKYQGLTGKNHVPRFPVAWRVK